MERGQSMNSEAFEKERQPIEVVELTDAVYQSYLGRYFLGRTNIMMFDEGHYAWGGLVNPPDSRVNMFLNAYTISNFADQPLTAEGWLSGTFHGSVRTSVHAAAGNQAISPPPRPRVKIQSASFVSEPPTGGVYTFVRRVEPEITLTKHDFQGMYIIPPGSSFVLFFLPSAGGEVRVKIAFGWWEKKTAAPVQLR